MSTLSWNYHGLGNPRTVEVLKDLVRSKKPMFLFLIETLATYNTVERIRGVLSFEGLFMIDREGSSGGLTFMWKEK